MKIFLRIFLIIIFVGIISGCADNEAEMEVYEIANRSFSQQMSAIMFDTENFLGQAIRYEGSFVESVCGTTGDAIYHVVQFGASCCGPGDGLGFEVYLNDIPSVAPFTWIEITGVLEEVSIEGVGDVLRLNVLSMYPVEARP